MRKISHMESASDTLALIASSFGDDDGLVERTFKNDREFRSICRDYCECKNALERWQASDAAVAELRQQEYSELLDDLGQDVKEWLDNLRAIS